MNKFCERLKELRIEKKLTQKELATIIQPNNSSVCDRECGRSEPGIDIIIKLCNFFDITSDYLLGIKDY